MTRVRLGSLADFEIMDSCMDFTLSHKLRTDVEEARICIGIVQIPLQLYKVQAFFSSSPFFRRAHSELFKGVLKILDTVFKMSKRQIDNRNSKTT